MTGGKRVGAGRPATGHDPSRTFRLSDEFMANLQAWAVANDVTRSEGIRRLVELGLLKSAPTERVAAARETVSASSPIASLISLQARIRRTHRKAVELLTVTSM